MPLPGQTPEGPEGKYSPIQMAEWLITEAASFKDPQELLTEMGRQGFDMVPSESPPMDDPMMDEEPPMDEPSMGDPLMDEPPMDEAKGKGKEGRTALLFSVAEKAIGGGEDKKAKKKAEDEEEGY